VIPGSRFDESQRDLERDRAFIELQLLSCRSGVARIQREYDALAPFAAGAAVHGNAALAVATACLTSVQGAPERVEQLALAGALIALQIERLLATERR
jgi:hypothetical protein